MLFPHLNVTFNGSHTPMGNWGKLERRFEYLSEDRRWAFYATNTDRLRWGRTALRVYFDGNLVATSEGIEGAPKDHALELDGERVPAKLVRDEAALESGEVEGFRGLVFDVPGRLLQTR